MRDETNITITTTTRKGFQVRKKYGLMSFIGDLFMVALTGGLWLIWIFVREMRNN